MTQLSAPPVEPAAAGGASQAPAAPAPATPSAVAGTPPAQPAPAAPPAVVPALGGNQPPQQPEPPAPPVTYNLKAPEGRSWDETSIGAYSKAVQDLGVPPEAAQKLLDQVAPVLAERQEAQIQAVRTRLIEQWGNELAAHPQLGGNRLRDTLAVADRALSYGPPDLLPFLQQFGLDRHPAIVQWAHAIGTALSPDRLDIKGPPAVPTKPLATDENAVAERLFGSKPTKK